MREAHVLRVAGAAANWVAAQHRKVAEAAGREYERVMKGLYAQSLGTTGQDVDAQGRPILRTTAQVRRWFFEQGGLRV